MAAHSVQVLALTSAGPVELPPHSGASTIHDVFDSFPRGVYSAMRTFRRERFLELDAHLNRTDRCMELLGWSWRLDRPALRRALARSVASSPDANSTLRFDALSEPVPVGRDEAQVILARAPFHELPEAFVREGVRIELTRELARTTPLVKTTDWVIRRRPYPLGTQEAFEHVMVDPEGRILEGTSANVFAVRGRELVTAGALVLEGITARVVARIAEERGLRVRWDFFREKDLAQLDELFLTSSVRGVVPIVAAGSVRIGTGEPGATTLALREGYLRAAESESRPAV